jgi:hypothetical protein
MYIDMYLCMYLAHYEFPIKILICLAIKNIVGVKRVRFIVGNNVVIIIFSNIDYENETFITQFSEENRCLHH